MSTDTRKHKIRVGIVGLRPHESWAAIMCGPTMCFMFCSMEKSDDYLTQFPRA
jgi:hypothetical protein